MPAWSENFRDLGGLPVGGGGQIRPGTLFRGEAPEALSEASRKSLGEIRLVVDLRSSGEAASESVWPSSSAPDIVRLPLVPGQRLYGPDTVLRLATEADFALEYITDLYADLLRLLPDAGLSDLAERIGHRRQVPVLIHCTAGQDRTGVLIAVLLLALGVPRDVVVADYARSAESWNLARCAHWTHDALGPGRHTLSKVALRQTMALARHMEKVIDRIDDDYGSIEAYWASAGVDAAALRNLREVLCQQLPT